MDINSIEPNILSKALHNAVQQSLYNKYTKNGFKVYLEHKIEDYQADLFCKKGTESIVIEVRTIGVDNRHSISKMLKIKKHIESNFGYKFKIEYIKLPVNKTVKIDNIELIIEDEIRENFPSEFDSLSTHTTISEVENVEIESINIDKDGININGSADIGLELQYGSNSDLENDGGDVLYKSAKITFELELGHDYKVREFNYEPEIDEDECD